MFSRYQLVRITSKLRLKQALERGYLNAFYTQYDNPISSVFLLAQDPLAQVVSSRRVPLP